MLLRKPPVRGSRTTTLAMNHEQRARSKTTQLSQAANLFTECGTPRSRGAAGCICSLTTWLQIIVLTRTCAC